MSEAQQGYFSVQTQLQIPGSYRYSTVCHRFDGRVLPERLQEKLLDFQYWITFSDGVHVVGTSTPTENTVQQDCRFEILAADGTEQGHFSHVSVREIIPFLDQFIVTAACAGDLKIWSRTGQELTSQHLGYRQPTIISDNQARLIAFENPDHHLRDITVFDFGASQLDIQTKRTGRLPTRSRQWAKSMS